MGVNMDTKELEKKFLNSNWPNTDALADVIKQLSYEEAREIFLKGLKARRHGIRTASIRGIASYNQQEMVDVIRGFLADPSYETRMEAKMAVKILTGEDVKTAKGE